MTALDAQEYTRRLCIERGLSHQRLLSPCRWQRYVDARQEIALVLRTAGWTFPAIGGLLWRDASTIVSLTQRPLPSTRTKRPRRMLEIRDARDRARARFENHVWIEDGCEEVLA